MAVVKKITKRKILITGGAGFVGYHLAQHLLTQNPRTRITLVDNLQRGRMDADFKNLLKEPGVKFLNLDLTDPRAYARIGSGYDHVFHLAAVNGTRLFYEMPHEVLRTNVLTTAHILEWFRAKNRGGKILFTSSNEVYAGALEAFGKLPIPTPETVPLVIADVANPRWSYAATKLVGEQFFIHYARRYGFRMAIVRPHNFYGPRAGWDHVVPEFIERIKRRTDPFPIYGASDTRSFCYIEDAVRAMAMIMESARTDGETYHVGVMAETKIKDLAGMLFRVAGWRPKKLELHDSPRGSVRRRAPDTTRIQKDVGWQPAVSLAEGLARTYEWYQKSPSPSKRVRALKIWDSP